jgi:hypothetical protein
MTLRDFLPPVIALSIAGYDRLAHQITFDLLNSYMKGLLIFVHEMTEILNASTT